MFSLWWRFSWKKATKLVPKGIERKKHMQRRSIDSEKHKRDIEEAGPSGISPRAPEKKTPRKGDVFSWGNRCLFCGEEIDEAKERKKTKNISNLQSKCIGTYRTLSQARLHFKPCYWSIFVTVCLREFFFSFWQTPFQISKMKKKLLLSLPYFHQNERRNSWSGTWRGRVNSFRVNF